MKEEFLSITGMQNLSLCQKESQDVIMNNIQDLYESHVHSLGKQKTWPHFISQIKKDLFDSVEGLKIYA